MLTIAPIPGYTSALMLLLAACTDPEPVPDAPGPEAAPALDIPGYEADDIVAVWTADEAVDAIEAALAGRFPSPLAVRESLAGWFRHGDEGCPGLGTYMAGASFEGCVSAEGWYYLGVGGYSETFQDDDGGGFVELSIMGDLTILAPDARVIDVGGHWLAILREGGPAWSAVLNGTWLEPASDVDWLAQGMSAWLDYAGAVREDGHTITLDGGLTIRGTTIGFRDVTLGADGCYAVPTGAITVLDPGGGTWTVDYADTCERCGTVSFEGAPVTTDACLTLDGLGERIIEASTP